MILHFKVNAQTTVKVSLKKYLNFGNLLWNGDKCTGTDDYCPKILEFCVKEFPPPPTTFGSCLYYNKTKASTSNVIDFELTPTDIDQNIELKISSYTVSRHTFCLIQQQCSEKRSLKYKILLRLYHYILNIPSLNLKND